MIVTIDAMYGLEQLNTQPEALKQAAVADVLLITKSDIATSEQLAALQETLNNINAGATQQLVIHGEIDPLAIIDVGLFSFNQQQAVPQRWLRAPTPSQAPNGTLPKKSHDNDIQNFTVALPTGIQWQQFKTILLKLCQTHGEGLLRLKGILHCEDQRHPLAIHAVHFTPYPAMPLTNWQEENPFSRVVIIGKKLDENAIRKSLTQF